MFNQVEIRVALKRVFDGIHVSYTVDPTLDGKVTANLKDVPFETALRSVLNQVNGTYRVDHGIYECIARESVVETMLSTSAGFEKMPEFRPGEYSGSYGIRDKTLFLTPHRTMGGTYDLLAEAASVAGFSEWFAYRYGNNGFAVVLPFEAIQDDGLPLSGRNRFRFRPNMGFWDFRRIIETFRAAIGTLEFSYRVEVLLVTSDPIISGGSTSFADIMRPTGYTNLPDSVRKRRWEVDPRLTVLVYEFRRKNGKRDPVLMHRGESGISAKQHVVYAGLWRASQLR